jgi:hypothetical protein
MTWATEIVKPTVKTAYYFYFAGIPYKFATWDLTSRPTSNSWTDADFTWKEMLDVSNTSISTPKLNRSAGLATSGNIQIKLVDDDSFFLTSLFSFYSDNNLSATTTTSIIDLEWAGVGKEVNVTLADSLGGTIGTSTGTAGLLYAGNETWEAWESGTSGGYTSEITIKTRGMYDSDPETYLVENTGTDDAGDELSIGVLVTTQPTTWLNRKVYLYEVILDGDGNPLDSAPGDVNEKLIFKGFVTEFGPDSGACAWNFMMNDTLILLEREIGVSVTQKNIDTSVVYDNSQIVVDFNGSFERAGGESGPYESYISLDRTNTIRKKESIISELAEKLSVSKFRQKNPGYYNDIYSDEQQAASLGGQVDYKMVGKDTNRTDPNLEFDESVDPPDHVAFFIVNGGKSDNVSLEIHPWHEHIFGDSSIAFSYENKGYTTFRGLPAYTDNMWTSTAYVSGKPPLRILSQYQSVIVFVDGDAFNTSTLALPINSTNQDTVKANPNSWILIGGKEIALIANETSLTGYSYNKKLMSLKGGDKDHTANALAHVRATHMPVFYEYNAIDMIIELMHSFSGYGTVTGGNGAYDVLADGFGARIHAEYINAAEILALKSQYPDNIIGNRLYVFNKRESIASIMREEAKTLGLYFILDDDFKITAKKTIATSEDTASYPSISATNTVGVPAMTMNLDSMVNRVEIHNDWQIEDDKFSDTVVVNKIGSQKKFKQINTLSIKNKGFRIPVGADEKFFGQSVAATVFAEFSEPYPVITVECDRTVGNIKTGDIVNFSTDMLPNMRSRTVGYSNELMLVYHSERNLGNGHITMTLLNINPNVTRGRLVPCLKINDSTPTGTTITVEQNEYSSTGNDTDYFDADDYVCYFDVSTQTLVTGQVSQVVSATSTTITIDTGFTGIADGDIIMFAKYADVTSQRQESHVYVCDRDAQVIDSGGKDDKPFRYA